MRDRNDRMLSRSSNYVEFFRILKKRIQAAQAEAAISVDRELVLLYCQTGHEIINRQATEQWGAKVIDRSFTDIRCEFSDLRGFSPRNRKGMRTFVNFYSDWGQRADDYQRNN